jgi:putative transposase
MRRHRKPTRLPGFETTLAGAYFITLCSYHRRYLFGSVSDEVFVPTEVGLLIQREWQRSESIRPEIQLDAWVLMPNHLQGVVWIQSEQDDAGATSRSPLRTTQLPCLPDYPFGTDPFL